MYLLERELGVACTIPIAVAVGTNIVLIDFHSFVDIF